MTNKSVARHLKLASDLLEVTGGNAFRARAYARAARVVDRMEKSVASYDAQELTTVQGIGKGLAGDIREILETGSLAQLDRLLESLPPGLPEVLRVKGLGPKKVRTIWQELDVSDLDTLESAASTGRLADLPGFGAKTVQNILASIQNLKAYRGKAHLATAHPEAERARDLLRAAGHRAEIAGEIRRQCSIVDRAVIVTDASETDTAPSLSGLSADDGFRLPSGLPLHLVHTTPDAFGTALWTATVSEAHLSLWRETFGDPHEAEEEEAIFESAGVPFIPPAIREGTWEIEAARLGTLPVLVTVGDLKGTLHNHSTWSDGANSLHEMAEAARARGLLYYGIGDHSRSLQIAHGLSLDELARQSEEAGRLNAEYASRGIDFRILSGSECDILKDGAMDFPDEALEALDIVVASVHSHFAMSEDEATARLIRAVENPHVDILGHPTGRLLLRREGYPIDVDAVLDACAEHGTAVELNANPWRLDLDWRFLRGAAERGVPVSINPDAHVTDGLDDVQWGVAAAQKAGLSATDVLNTRTTDDLLTWTHGNAERDGSPQR
ncbi:MAG: helix-hairpin-helix domain-containing protein [Bacteroidota bacterium]